MEMKAKCKKCGNEIKPYTRQTKTPCECGCGGFMVRVYVPKKSCPQCGEKSWELI